MKTRIAKCEHLFKNDSNFLTYRPPTPDLLTEDEVEAPEPLRFKIDETIVSLEKPFIV